LTYRTAPALRSIWARIAVSVDGLLARAEMPTEASLPGSLKESLREMGRPWRGPSGLPVLER
jgi:hypothetical protein